MTAFQRFVPGPRGGTRGSLTSDGERQACTSVNKELRRREVLSRHQTAVSPLPPPHRSNPPAEASLCVPPLCDHSPIIRTMREPGRRSGSMLMLIFFTVSSGATKRLRLNPTLQAAVSNERVISRFSTELLLQHSAPTPAAVFPPHSHIYEV